MQPSRNLTLQNLAEPGGKAPKFQQIFGAHVTLPPTTPDHLKTLVEPWWEPCGTFPRTPAPQPLQVVEQNLLELVEPWWKPCQTFLKPP